MASTASFDNDYTEPELYLDSAIITVLDAEIRKQLSLWRTYPVPSIDELEKWGLPVEICSKLQGMISDEWGEDALVVAFFEALSLPGNQNMFSRGVRRWIKHQSRALNVTESLIIEILVLFDSDLVEVI